mmetsp:Transcript_16818/g.25306  ORF Transcript_16818/g.25306 Transcript_16818/m.25306 type:complete len:257 (-) Transcript_16818:1780-2550(-)
MNEAKQTVESLERAVPGNPEEAARLLAQAKLTLLRLEESGPNNNEQFELGRRAMEQGVLLAVTLRDSLAFERSVAQLKPYYAINTNSPLRPTIIGLELLFLIVENRLSEFHMNLELLSEAERSIPEISFAIALERDLMVGTYDLVLKAQQSMPSPYFSFFMSRLLDTVRDTIAECAQLTYKTLSLSAAKDLLMFDNTQDLSTFLAKFPNWKIVSGKGGGDNYLIFDTPQHEKSQSIPALKLISEHLAYATELERIV